MTKVRVPNLNPTEAKCKTKNGNFLGLTLPNKMGAGYCHGEHLPKLKKINRSDLAVILIKL